MAPNRSRSVRRWLPWLVLFGLAFGLRLYFVGQARFAGDEARFYAEAHAVVETCRIPGLGAPVTGGPARLPGATFSPLISLPLLLVRSPLSCMVLVVLLNMLGYGLWARVVRQVKGERTALVFATLLLLSPWSFLYSDRIWNPRICWSCSRACACGRSGACRGKTGASTPSGWPARSWRSLNFTSAAPCCGCSRDWPSC